MDEQTALVLALQLLALFSIAGALLAYLLCKIRAGTDFESHETATGAGKPILITSCDNAVGLQIALHMANRGFRVFAGLKEGASSGSSDDSVSSRVIRSWQKHRESLQCQGQGTIVALPLDVTREDILREAVDIIRAHLPAGEDGIWAVLNTSGICFRGRLDQQDISHWDTMLKTNVVGILRTTRAFQSLLRNTKGRIISVGASENLGAGLVAYTGTRYGIDGIIESLRLEVAPMEIKVIAVNTSGIAPELLYAPPKLKQNDGTETTLEMEGALEYQPQILNSRALEILDVALTIRTPKNRYVLNKKYKLTHPLHFMKIV